MRIQHFLLSAIGVLMLLTGCRKEPVSPVDPLPFPMDGNKGLTVAPEEMPGTYCDGTVTLMENIADLGGVTRDHVLYLPPERRTKIW